MWARPKRGWHKRKFPKRKRSEGGPSNWGGSSVKKLCVERAFDPLKEAECTGKRQWGGKVRSSKKKEKATKEEGCSHDKTKRLVGFLFKPSKSK